MAITVKQAEVMDALFNGGYLWRAGEVYFLARASRSTMGEYYQSQRINSKTAIALINSGLVELKGEHRWFAKA